ncbi:MAG: hypothetical protein SAK29_12175 [Scytonema sp. PMC 1069.18]|nr:hypothetical protein [Scytonema sp. PMC 1069.18]MEC4886850.1 hypothetical protein [Scytonema sp. PMC 1070.18]
MTLVIAIPLIQMAADLLQNFINIEICKQQLRHAMAGSAHQRRYTTRVGSSFRSAIALPSP